MNEEIRNAVIEKARRYNYLKNDCRIKQKGLDDKEKWDMDWIKEVCDSESERVVEYHILYQDMIRPVESYDG